MKKKIVKLKHGLIALTYSLYGEKAAKKEAVKSSKIYKKADEIPLKS